MRTEGYTLVELLAVMAVMVILMGLSVAAMLGFRTPGLRQAAISQLMATFDEARMSAIEKGVKVYVGFADGQFPNKERRLRSYILYREYTGAEREEMAGSQPSAGTVRPLTKWRELPRGFYLDPVAQASLLANADARVTPAGLPGDAAEIYAIGFNRLGQVVTPQGATPLVAVTEARYEPETGKLTRLEAEDENQFMIQINRLTGRVQLRDDAVR